MCTSPSSQLLLMNDRPFGRPTMCTLAHSSRKCAADWSEIDQSYRAAMAREGRVCNRAGLLLSVVCTLAAVAGT